jgi:RNA polymerase sigma-B factor
VQRYLPLVRHLARRYHARADRDDLDQVASMALLQAVRRFDPERGLAFSSFAVPTILGELKRYFRDHGWVVRVPRAVQELKRRLEVETEILTAQLGRAPTPKELAERTQTSVEQVLDALAATTAHQPDSLDRPLAEGGDSAIDQVGGRLDPGFEHVEDSRLVDSLLTVLTERDRLILRLRFEHDLTQADIGERLGLSQMHVSRLIRESLLRLRAAAVD